ncbi:hypothetical protein BKA70DRAFT_672334 [Coprinopsis sp. MPI-PUGE-AT-0042]|nr:hypothetical protein BKA70DRAFT_672334 [Coprinopsis sp. MPI-PUGE-AT-0042]
MTITNKPSLPACQAGAGSARHPLLRPHGPLSHAQARAIEYSRGSSSIPHQSSPVNAWQAAVLVGARRTRRPTTSRPTPTPYHPGCRTSSCPPSINASYATQRLALPPKNVPLRVRRILLPVTLISSRKGSSLQWTVYSCLPTWEASTPPPHILPLFRAHRALGHKVIHPRAVFVLCIAPKVRLTRCCFCWEYTELRRSLRA